MARRNDLFTGNQSSITPSLTREFQRVMIWNPTASAWKKLQVGAAGFNGLGGGNELGQQGGEHPGSYEDGFGSEIGIAQRWERDNMGILYIIKPALGGTSIDRWQKVSGDLYNSRLVAHITNAKAALTAQGLTPDIKTFYWMQGESDAGQPQTYQSKLTTFMNDVKADFLQPATKILIGGLLPNNGFDGVNAAQQAYVAATPNAYWLDSISYSHIPNDSVHIDGRSILTIGGVVEYNIAFNSTGTIDFNGSTPVLPAAPQAGSNTYLAQYKSYMGNNTTSVWEDYSGANHHLTQNLTPYQMSRVTGLNGKMAYRANGGQRFNIPVLNTNTGDYTIIIAAKSDVMTQQFISDHLTSLSSRIVTVAGNSSGTYYDGAFHGAIGNDITQPSILVFRLNRNGATIRKNGILVTNGTYTPQPLGEGSLGGERDKIDGAVLQAGFIGELYSYMVYSGNMSDAQVLAVEAELGTELGISVAVSTAMQYLGVYKSYQGSNNASQWTDLSGNNRHLTQSLSGNQMIMSADANNLPVYMASGQQFFNMPAYSALSGDYTIIVALQVTAPAAVFVTDHFTTSSARVVTAVGVSSGAYYDGVFKGVVNPVLTAPTPAIIVYRLNSAGATVRKNGVLVASDTYVQQPLGAGRVGAEADTPTKVTNLSAGLQGNLYALLVYAGNMTDAEVFSVETILKNEIGIVF